MTEPVELTEEEKRLKKAARWIGKKLSSHTFTSHPSHYVSELLERAAKKFGIEHSGVEGGCDSVGNDGYSYLNMGDMYVPTVYVTTSSHDATVCVGCLGDFLEAHSNEQRNEEWEAYGRRTWQGAVTKAYVDFVAHYTAIHCDNEVYDVDLITDDQWDAWWVQFGGVDCEAEESTGSYGNPSAFHFDTNRAVARMKPFVEELAETYRQRADVMFAQHEYDAEMAAAEADLKQAEIAFNVRIGAAYKKLQERKAGGK